MGGDGAVVDQGPLDPDPLDLDQDHDPEEDLTMKTLTKMTWISSRKILVLKSRKKGQEFKSVPLMREVVVAVMMGIFLILKEEEEILLPQEKQMKKISVALLWMKREDPSRGKRQKESIF